MSYPLKPMRYPWVLTKPPGTRDKTAPVTVRVRCSRVRVRVHEIIPGGYPCHPLEIQQKSTRQDGDKLAAECQTLSSNSCFIVDTGLKDAIDLGAYSVTIMF
jgi:hypothetical protein